MMHHRHIPPSRALLVAVIVCAAFVAVTMVCLAVQS